MADLASDTPSGLSRRLRGSGCIEVQVRGPGTKLQVVRELPGVRSVSVETADSAAQKREVLLTIETDVSSDVREALFFAMAARSWPILEMKTIDMSLEDVFLKLTTEESLGDEMEVAPGA